MVSRRAHSRYQRKLADTESGGHEVLIGLSARRFRCCNDTCPKATFAEQVPGLTTRYGRRTCGLQTVCGRWRWRWRWRSAAAPVPG